MHMMRTPVLSELPGSSRRAATSHASAAAPASAPATCRRGGLPPAPPQSLARKSRPGLARARLPYGKRPALARIDASLPLAAPIRPPRRPLGPRRAPPRRLRLGAPRSGGRARASRGGLAFALQAPHARADRPARAARPPPAAGYLPWVARRRGGRVLRARGGPRSAALPRGAIPRARPRGPPADAFASAGGPLGLCPRRTR